MYCEIKCKISEQKKKVSLGNEFGRNYAYVILVILISVLCVKFVTGTPIGPTANYVSNSTADLVTNTSINESTGGKYIYTYVLTSVEKNTRWKAYVGNVSGSLALQDSNSNSVYEWDLGALTGEVYATKNSSTITWTNINCTWAAAGDKNDSSNRTVENHECAAMGHTREDNITATFANNTHPSFSVGDKDIPANYCWSLYPWVNDTKQDDFGSSNFPELMMYDGTDYESDPGSIVYVGIVEDDKSGYKNGTTYDFQMILPERGETTWSGVTPYYFYTELA